MNIDRQTIDGIVANVLSQLGSGLSSPLKTTSPGLVLDATVITEEVLEQQSVTGQQLLIGPKAVITPSGRDWLRKRNINWQRQINGAKSVAGDWTLLTCEKSNSIDQLKAEAERLGWNTETATNGEEAAVWAISHIEQHKTAGIVVLTEQPERLVCRANRNTKIRGGAIDSVADMKRVQQELGANLVTLRAGERGFFQLRMILKQIQAGGPPTQPSDW